jgi:hypothetical protein
LRKQAVEAVTAIGGVTGSFQLMVVVLVKVVSQLLVGVGSSVQVDVTVIMMAKEMIVSNTLTPYLKSTNLKLMSDELKQE